MAKINWTRYAEGMAKGKTPTDEYGNPLGPHGEEQWNVNFSGSPESDAAGNQLPPIYEPPTAMTQYGNPGPFTVRKEKVTEPWYDMHGNQVKLSTLGLGTVSENIDQDGYSYIVGKRGEEYTTRPYAGRGGHGGLRAAKRSVRR